MKNSLFILIFSLITNQALALPFGARELQADYLTGIRTVRNFIQNYGAEQNVNYVTGTNVTVTRNTTAPIEGIGDFSFTIDSATDVVTWASNTFDKKLSGQTCEAKLRYTADANATNVKFQVYQGASLISSVALKNSTTPVPASIIFPCGNLSSATTLKIAGSAATSTVMKVDSVFVGESEPVKVDSAVKLINQNAHGFTVGQVLYYTGSTYALANANADATADVVGVVSEVVDVNNFYLTTVGFVSGLSGLVSGSTYYLSDTVAGALTATAPTVGPSVNKPILIAVSTATGYVIQSRGYVIGPASIPQLVMSDWISYTPTIGATTTPPTLGTGASMQAAYRRIGDSMQIAITYTQTGGGSVGSGTYLFPLPGSFTMDTNKISLSAGVQSKGGVGIASWYGIRGIAGYAVAYNSTNLAIIAGSNSDATNFMTSSNGGITGAFQLTINAIVPIAGWTATSSGQVSAPRSEVTVDTGNVYGSTATMIPRFNNIRKNLGSAITYADSSTNGASFTINEDGVYAISYTNGGGAGAGIGITVNENLATTGTTSITIYSITYAQGFRAMNEQNTAGRRCFVGWSGFLNAGDVVRPHDNGNSLSSTATTNFSIVKVSN